MLYFIKVATACHAFSVARNESLHAAFIYIGTNRDDQITVTSAEMHHPLPLCSHPLFRFYKHSAAITECQGTTFSAFSENFSEFNETPLLHPHFHMRHHSVRLPCAAIPCMATACSIILVERFRFYCHTTNTHP